MMVVASVPIWFAAAVCLFIGVCGMFASLDPTFLQKKNKSASAVFLGGIIVLLMSAAFGSLAAWMVR